MRSYNVPIHGRLKELIRLFDENNNVLTTQQICAALDCNHSSIHNFASHHWIESTSHGHYKLHSDVIKKIHKEIPGGYLRRDIQTFVQTNQHIDIHASLENYLKIRSKQQSLLLDRVIIHPDWTYTLKFHPARYNHLLNKVVFDVAKGISENKLQLTATRYEIAGHWETGAYFRQLAREGTLFSEHILQQSMKSIYAEYGRSLRVEKISLNDFHTKLPTIMHQNASRYDKFIYDFESKTFLFNIDETNVQNYKEKLLDALEDVRRLSGEDTFKKIASITLKRVLPAAGLAFNANTVAHAQDQTQALFEECTSWLGSGLGLTAGAAVAAATFGTGGVAVAVGMAAGAVLGEQAMEPFNQLFAVARSAMTENPAHFASDEEEVEENIPDYFNELEDVTENEINSQDEEVENVGQVELMQQVANLNLNDDVHSDSEDIPQRNEIVAVQREEIPAVQEPEQILVPAPQPQIAQQPPEVQVVAPAPQVQQAEAQQEEIQRQNAAFCLRRAHELRRLVEQANMEEETQRQRQVQQVSHQSSAQQALLQAQLLAAERQRQAQKVEAERKLQQEQAARQAAERELRQKQAAMQAAANQKANKHLTASVQSFKRVNDGSCTNPRARAYYMRLAVYHCNQVLSINPNHPSALKFNREKLCFFRKVVTGPNGNLLDVNACQRHLERTRSNGGGNSSGSSNRDGGNRISDYQGSMFGGSGSEKSRGKISEMSLADGKTYRW